MSYFFFSLNYKYFDVQRDVLGYLFLFTVVLQTCLDKNTGNGKLEGNAAH